MFRLVCLLNAVLVLPFAASALAAPHFTFANFGIDLGAEGAGVAQGYGATALGWGLVCLLLSGSLAAETTRAVLIASLAFNVAEVVIQVPIALSGIASPMIWVTIVAHALVGGLSFFALVQQRAAA